MKKPTEPGQGSPFATLGDLLIKHTSGRPFVCCVFIEETQHVITLSNATLVSDRITILERAIEAYRGEFGPPVVMLPQ